MLLLALTVVACGMSKEDIEKEVSISVREKLNESNPDPYIWVPDVTLVHQGGSRYTGVVTLSDRVMPGAGNEEQHDIEVTCDGDSLVWEMK